jgi:hypothetical protein
VDERIEVEQDEQPGDEDVEPGQRYFDVDDGQPDRSDAQELLVAGSGDHDAYVGGDVE